MFGTILENNIYILIDTSQSMQHHLGFVKEKLRLLIQVCLRKVYSEVLLINQILGSIICKRTY